MSVCHINVSRFTSRLNVRTLREFAIHLPHTERSKIARFVSGVYSTDITKCQNPHDVYKTSVSSFGEFGLASSGVTPARIRFDSVGPVRDCVIAPESLPAKFISTWTRHGL